MWMALNCHFFRRTKGGGTNVVARGGMTEGDVWLDQEPSSRSPMSAGSDVGGDVNVAAEAEESGDEGEESGRKMKAAAMMVHGINFGEEAKDGEVTPGTTSTEERIEAVRRDVAELSLRMQAIRDEQEQPSPQGDDDPSAAAAAEQRCSPRDDDDPRREERLRNLNSMEQRLAALSRAAQGHLATDVVVALEGGVAIVREFVENFSSVVDEDVGYTRLEKVQQSIEKLSIKVEAIKRSEEELDSDPRRADRLENLGAIEERLRALAVASAAIEVCLFFPRMSV